MVVTDTLPAGVSFVSTSGCGEDPSGVASCSLGEIASGGSAQYTITVTVAAATSGTITNSVSVSSDTSDPNASNDTASEDTTVSAPPVATGTVVVTKQFVDGSILPESNQTAQIVMNGADVGPPIADDASVQMSFDDGTPVTITESGLTSFYDATIDCGSGGVALGSGFDVTVVEGQQIDCTLTNTRQTASLTIAKVLSPSDPSQWDITVAGQLRGTIGDGGSVTLVVPSSTVGPAVVESAVSPASDGQYDSALQCSGGSGLSTPGKQFDVPALAAGGQATCTFTNTLISPDIDLTMRRSWSLSPVRRARAAAASRSRSTVGTTAR